MGRRNYLIEGVSCTGKTSVCRELKRRGYHALNGDRELAYRGDPGTGEPVEGITGLAVHRYHIWDVAKVQALVADHERAVTFLCGGSRNFPKLLDLLDGVFILEIDLETLTRRLDQRPADDWGWRPEERELILRLHHTKEEIPKVGTIIDATVPITQVADEILCQVEAEHR